MAFLFKNFEKVVCVILFLSMTALGFVNIVVRYATEFSFAASEELLTNGFLLLTIFGAAVAAERGEHLAVTLIADSLPRPAARAVFVLASALSVVLLALSAWFTWVLIANQVSSGITSYALQIPVWYYSIAVPFGFALILFRYVQYAARHLRDSAEEVTPDV
ncbi:TRAP transporter small permease [Qingshengfaniella alkalisoli]|uniref:TRAP transporter small permease protein n=1 Tax=Qingshengfaniella alkalisoli TaxID=2599296 RepID=A0A5B8IVJ6_9RHOB|nr:TRAP transporter small permease [Qingshengfaniella alkalisoli]QDY69634.1 TRAP transporter small permease [Qingshengfaniella alkalisoli]